MYLYEYDFSDDDLDAGAQVSNVSEYDYSDDDLDAGAQVSNVSV